MINLKGQVQQGSLNLQWLLQAAQEWKKLFLNVEGKIDVMGWSLTLICTITTNMVHQFHWFGVFACFMQGTHQIFLRFRTLEVIGNI